MRCGLITIIIGQVINIHNVNKYSWALILHYVCRFWCSWFTLSNIDLCSVLSGGSVNALRVVHVIPSEGRARYAVTSRGDEVFVSSYNSHQIEVYSTSTFTLQRSLTIPGLGACCYGLVACIRNNCLYASDHSNSSIHRVDLSDTNAVKSWLVGSEPTGLSVNKAHNVVVTCGVNKLQEYTTRGSLVREISIQCTDLTKPWHAVQLSTGDYMVSHGASPGVVTIVGVDGQVVCSFDQSVLSTVGQMKYPKSLAVTKNDDILVVDAGNNRILSVNSSLSSVQVLSLPVDDGVQGPWGLYLDESQGRLYVSEWGGRVWVLEIVALSHWAELNAV